MHTCVREDLIHHESSIRPYLQEEVIELSYHTEKFKFQNISNKTYWLGCHGLTRVGEEIAMLYDARKIDVGEIRFNKRIQILQKDTMLKELDV